MEARRPSDKLELNLFFSVQYFTVFIVDEIWKKSII